MTRKSENRIPALDGIRGLAVLIIAWYHIWQQSWLMPNLKIPAVLGLKETTLSLDFIPRTGFLFVDLMLLLSAFCLFLPYARNMWNKELPLQSTVSFYQKRVARIFPSYYLAVVVLFVTAIVSGSFSNGSEAVSQLISTSTFTQMFRINTYLNNKINGVLWTVAVEVLFYLTFPLFSKWFRKQPIITYAGMALVSTVYLQFIVLKNQDTIRMTLNQFIGFLGVFANGMAFACLYVKVESLLKERPDWLKSLLSFAGIAVSIWFISWFEHNATKGENVMIFQAAYRFRLSLVFGLLVFSASIGGKVIQTILGNPVMHFLGAISFNLYIWHQWLAVHLKNMHVPFWTGEELPNMIGNKTWQHQYTFLCFAISIALAALITYCYEKPLNRLILKTSWEKKGKK